MAICGREVYSYDFADRRSVVVKPYNCLVGCTTCSNLCPAGAIEFPSIEIVREAIKKYGVFKVVKEKLKEKVGDFVEGRRNTEFAILPCGSVASNTGVWQSLSPHLKW